MYIFAYGLLVMYFAMFCACLYDKFPKSCVCFCLCCIIYSYYKSSIVDSDIKNQPPSSPEVVPAANDSKVPSSSKSDYWIKDTSNSIWEKLDKDGNIQYYG